jgi:hopene-associated glycosyltransferase HpnB
MIVTAISVLALGGWTYLLLGRGWFWRCRERDDAVPLASEVLSHDSPTVWPDVVAVIPARDEADVITECVGSLLWQDYPGRFSIVVVDDQSSDGTAAAASALGLSCRLRVLPGSNVPSGWTGKLWAMRQGLAAAEAGREPPEFILFTDADIVYAPQMLRRLVAIARSKDSVLTSLMVKLRCESPAEHWLVPAFVFFFQKLYPFAWVNDLGRATAAAAGGCMLVQRGALGLAGGLEPVRGALIDDCALAARMKRQGAIWLGLTENVRSLRAYPAFADFGRMVARSAFAELRYSPLRLVLAVAGMGLLYLAPPTFALFAHGVPQLTGALAWALMGLSLTPTLRLYGRPIAGGLALPAVAAAYILFTLQSAVQYWRGRGGYWKGRFQAPMREAAGG